MSTANAPDGDIRITTRNDGWTKVALVLDEQEAADQDASLREGNTEISQ